MKYDSQKLLKHFHLLNTQIILTDLGIYKWICQFCLYTWCQWGTWCHS